MQNGTDKTDTFDTRKARFINCRFLLGTLMEYVIVIGNVLIFFIAVLRSRVNIQKPISKHPNIEKIKKYYILKYPNDDYIQSSMTDNTTATTPA